MKPKIYVHFIADQGWSDWARGFISVSELYQDTHEVIPLYEQGTSLQPWVSFANTDKYQPPINVNPNWYDWKWYCHLNKEMLDPYLTKEINFITGIGCLPKEIVNNYEYLYQPVPSIQDKVNLIIQNLHLPDEYQILHIRASEPLRDGNRKWYRGTEHNIYHSSLKKLDEIRGGFNKPVVVVSDSVELKSIIKRKYPDFIVSPSIPLHSGYNNTYTFDEAVSWFLDTTLIKQAKHITVFRGLYNKHNDKKNCIGGHFAVLISKIHHIPYIIHDLY